MKLRTKIILFFGMFLILIVVAVVLYSQYVVVATFKKQTMQTLRMGAEQAEVSYYTFLKSLKKQGLDWTSDPVLQEIVHDLLAAKPGAPARTRAENAFASYITEKKMPYERSIIMTEILDKKGIVIASTRPSRIGTDELREELELNAHYFSKTIVSNFTDTFVKSIVFEIDESTEPMVHVTVRFFSLNSDNTKTPLDAVLLVHFESNKDIADALLSAPKINSENKAGNEFLLNFLSSEIYLVNSEKYMVTPSLYASDLKQHQVVGSLPVQECLEKGKEVTGEYDDYRGVRVLGASICLENDGLVLLVEVNKDEALEPLASLARTAIFSGGIVLTFGIFIIILFVRRPLRRINEVVSALEKVMNGDMSVQMTERTKDEIGRLSSMFNTMVESIRRAQDDLRASKEEVERKAYILEEDLKEHKKQEKFLQESKIATLNLLEDSWKAKEKLEEEGIRLQTILSSIGDGLIIIDPEYKIVLLNTKALEIFSMSENELLYHSLRDVLVFTRRNVNLALNEWPTEEMFRTKRVVTTSLEDRFCITTKGREKELPVALSIAPLIGRFHGAVIVIRDIAGDYALDEAKSGFISVASHQLRTPLTSIRWYSEMLLSEDAGMLNKVQKDFMNEIHGGAERLYQTVDLLLGISRIESGKIKEDRTPINLNEFTEEISKEVKPQLDEKNLTLTLLPPSREPVIVWLDSLILRQVILNLISNAISYTNKDGVIETKWWVSEDGREAVVAVSDNGIGIPKAQQSRIFSKFFRAENARAQIPDGTGLGLALVRDLVDSWGGRIWFESEEGNGATFYFTVPFTTTTIFK